MKHEDWVKYRVYRKKTNRDDYIHYFSSHSERVKSLVVIAFSYGAHIGFSVMSMLPMKLSTSSRYL